VWLAVAALAAVQVSAQAVDRTFELANGTVSLTVEVLGGRLAGETLRWVGTPALEGGTGVLATDGGFSVELVWTGWQAPGRINNGDNAVSFTAREFALKGDAGSARDGARHLTLTFAGPEGLGVEVRYRLGDGDFFVRRRVRVFDTKDRRHFVERLWSLDAEVRTPAATLKAGGFGQPIALLPAAGGGAFLGLEWPAADNRLEQRGEKGHVRCGDAMGEVIGPEGVAGEDVVLAVTPDARVKLWFLDYLDTVRVARLRPYTLYNTWYDLRSAEYPKVAPDHVMNEENVLRIARRLRERMVERHGITLDAFVLDDGWDVYRSDWRLRPVQFPRGLGPVVEELEKSGTRLGVWFGPTGGYSFRKERVDWMREQGYETTGTQMWVGGPRYSALLERRTREMARAGVGYFKWDGFQFLATGPGLGTPAGIHARRAVLKTVERLARGVRALDADMFLNITSGTWLSPWWLGIADQIWMGGEDYGSADVPSISTRDSSITYRDLVLYEDFRANDLWFPISNLMTHGVLKGSIDVEEIGRDESLADFANEVVFYLARGVTMHELYISPDALSEDEWRVLSEALRWARDRFPVLSRGEMIGGDPNRREAYGWAHFAGRRGIVAARNPGIEQAALELTLDPRLGLDPHAGELVLERVYPTRWVDPRLHRTGERVEIPLLGYEAAVYEVYPLSEAAEPLLAGATFVESHRSETERTLRVLDVGSEVRLLDPSAVASLRVAGRACGDASAVAVARRPPPLSGHGVTAQGNSLRVQATLAERLRGAKLAVLLRPEAPSQGGKDPELRCTLDGRAVAPTTISVPGVWAWVGVPVSPGRHEFELEIGAPDGMPWIGVAQAWLVGAERVEPVETILESGRTMPAPRPLPPSGLGPDELPISLLLGSASLTPPAR
jgi:hypothetical protein